MIKWGVNVLTTSNSWFYSNENIIVWSSNSNSLKWMRIILFICKTCLFQNSHEVSTNHIQVNWLQFKESAFQKGSFKASISQIYNSNSKIRKSKIISTLSWLWEENEKWNEKRLNCSIVLFVCYDLFLNFNVDLLPFSDKIII